MAGLPHRRRPLRRQVPDPAVESGLFHRRRAILMERLGDSVAVVPTAPEQPRNGDGHYPFRPDSDFHYLTGFPEPEALAVLAPGREEGEFILFCRERDEKQETWHGRRAGLEGAVERYGADQAHPIGKLPELLPALLEERDRVYCGLGRRPELDARLIEIIAGIKSRGRRGARAPRALADLDPLLHEMRLVKDSEELEIMRRAAALSAEAHCAAMRSCRPGRYEYEIQAELEYRFRLGGSPAPAYPSIVAGGANACILHYTENDQLLRDGDLLLIDAGAELECYAADITRTFPVNGRFSAGQRAVYEVVLAAQKAAIGVVRAGEPWNRYHEVVVEVLTDGLVELGLLAGERAGLVEQESYKRFYMHRAGHWLGMDVHDVGDYKVDGEWRPLEPGMVLTVEPGLYIAAADDIDPRWHGIGVRIEDDVLVRDDGCEILTGGVPREIEEIERLMAEQ